MQSTVLAVVLVFLVFFAAMTVSVALRSGLDIFVVASLFIVALIGFGVIGALRNPPPDE
jgi:hydrogenase-4 membrane subunit HyfE